MRKAPARAGDSAAGNLRSIPAVERILSSAAFSSLVASFGRDNVKRHLADFLHTLRSERRPYDESQAAKGVSAALHSATDTTLRPVINGSGIIIHTNLGRSPVDPALWSCAAAVTTNYSNLEFDIAEGSRGRRDEHLTELC